MKTYSITIVATNGEQSSPIYSQIVEDLNLSLVIGAVNRKPVTSTSATPRRRATRSDKGVKRPRLVKSATSAT